MTPIKPAHSIHKVWTEPELWKRYKSAPSVRLRNEIVIQNMGLARIVARSESLRCKESYEDLEQLGFVGLTKAVERFNPNAGVRFSSFAVPYIKGEIQHYLRDKSQSLRLDRRIIEAVGKVRRITRKYPQFTAEQVAQTIGIGLEEWREMQNAIACKVVSLDWELSPIESEPLLTGSENVNSGRVLESLAVLPEQIRECVLGRFVLKLTDAQIAKQQKVLVDQVECIIAQGLEMLKQEMTDAAC